MSDTDFHSGNRDRQLGGTKASFSGDLDALAAYLTSLDTTPKSPHRDAAGNMTASAAAGESLFQARCATCHSGPDFTDSSYGVLHDVGTLTGDSGNRLGLTLPGLDTPGLRGVWATAPYLHDGSAADLMAVLTTRNAGDQHGVTSDLNAGQIQNLVDYLQQLDDSSASFANVPPPVDPNPDSDGIPTAFEEANGLDPYADDAGDDADSDGSDNGEEYARGTGVQDQDSDDDGLLDGLESNSMVYDDPGDPGTDPLDDDSDNDGFTDGEEVAEGTNPLDANYFPAPFAQMSSSAPTAEVVVSQSGSDYSIPWRHNQQVGVDRNPRDAAQTFFVDEGFTLDAVTVRVDLLATNGYDDDPFTFVIYEFTNATDVVPDPDANSPVYTTSVNLPSSFKADVDAGRDYLRINIPDVTLDGGQQYGFLLMFAGPAGVPDNMLLAAKANSPYTGGISLQREERGTAGDNFREGMIWNGSQTQPADLEFYLQEAPTTDYDTWTLNYPGADLGDPIGDFDGDRLNNDYERIFGLDPTSGGSVSP